MTDDDKKVDSLVAGVIYGIRSQQEEILKAFIAQYHCKPDEAIQILRKTEDGWFYWVEKRKGETNATS